MRKRSPRKWESIIEDDPGAGLLNLFDVWIAFAVALLLAMLSYTQVAGSVSAAADDKNQTQREGVKTPDKNRVPLEKYKQTSAKLSGEGQRLGTAYRLSNGEVVYVPDEQ